MERDILPFGASTYEALCTCVEADVEIIHVCRELYEEMKGKVKRTLRKYGYSLSPLPTRNGLLFAKKGIDLYRTGIIGAEWMF